MKKVIIFLSLFLAFSVNAQNVEEPDFVGECIVVRGDNSTVLLEKSTSQLKTSAGAGVIIAGIGSIKSKIVIDGCCASNKFKSNEDFKIIVKAVDNNTDPMAIVKVFRFEATKKNRKAEIASVNTFGTTKNNNLIYLPFTAKKFGASSYIITLKEKPVGEFGITVSNPNNLDEKSTVVSTFSIQ